MGLIIKNLKSAGYNHSDAPALWTYETTDTLSQVIETNYFADPRAEISPGDFMFVNASDGCRAMDVTSTSSVTLANGATSGWATYIDTQYPNSGNALSVTADTDTVLPNNKASLLETQKPVDISTFYNGTTITGRNGDALDIMIYFKAVPSAANQWLDMWIDIGGSVGELYRQTFSFPRGSGVERGILYSLSSAYTLGTWEANGGTVYIRSNASVDIYQINFNFDRSHKAS
jgi:hypothetical protein